jgi:hypothetical protein
MKILSKRAKICLGERKTCVFSTRIIFVHSQTRVTIPLRRKHGFFPEVGKVTLKGNEALSDEFL